MGFGAGLYVGTIYDCKPTVTYVNKDIVNNIPRNKKKKK